jgi:tungstate transport system ATP-binding protein
LSQLLFHGVEKRFGRRLILEGVDISLTAGHCQLLCGRNGAGKSTLLRILAGMERPDHAYVTVDGTVRQWRRAKKRLLAECIYLHQQPYLFEGSVHYNLNYPLRGGRAARESRIREGLEWSGLTALSEQPVHQLSSGERQRVALVRAWLRGPRVMLLDEPTANMDTACRQRTVELLQVLKQQGMALLVATHDIHAFAEVAESTWDLRDGRLRDADLAPADLPDKVTPIARRVRWTA